MNQLNFKVPTTNTNLIQKKPTVGANLSNSMSFANNPVANLIAENLKKPQSQESQYLELHTGGIIDLPFLDQNLLAINGDQSQTPSQSQPKEDILPDLASHQVSIPPHAGPRTRFKMDPVECQKVSYIRGNEFRRYQFDITQTCLFSNTIVSIPTGLGKTFIATNVILNYYKWFPKGKILFLAPTKSLITQQHKCLINVGGILGSDITEISGQVAGAKRKDIYFSHRIFFATPQTIKNDLIDNKYLEKNDIILIVIDEAHKTTGAYAYNEIIKNIYDESPAAGCRVIGLTATPGSDAERIKTVIKNLKASKIEHVGIEDCAVKKYFKGIVDLDINIQQHNAITEFVKYMDNSMKWMVDQ
jgi:hypothetical protein